MTTFESAASYSSTGDRRDIPLLPAAIRRTTWGAVFAGALAAIGVQIILTVLGVAVGATAFDAGDTGREVGVMAGLWWLITGTVSLTIGGAVVGRLAGIERSLDVALHGFAMWAVTAIFGVLALWSSATAASMAGANVAASTLRGTAIAVDANGDGVPEGTTTDRGATGAERVAVTDAQVEEARDAAQAASWWSLGGLLLGVIASVVATYYTAPTRIIVKPAAVAV